MEKNKTCIFCEIVNKNIPAKIFAENDKALAFLDINPISNGHLVVIPKKHFRNFSQTDKEYLEAVSNLAKECATKLYDSKLKPWGFNYLSNEEQIAGQEVFHYHMHVIPKYAKGEGISFSVNTEQNKPLENIIKILGLEK